MACPFSWVSLPGMGQAISAVLPFAIGVAISPVPIIAIILVLFSARARQEGVAFMVGWIAGLTVLSIVLYAIFSAADVSDQSSSASDTSHTIKLVLGVVLIVLAVRKWRTRPGPGETEPAPKWMSSLDSLSALKAAGLGALLSSVNPKNFVLAVGAATSLADLGSSGSEVVVGIVAFVVVGSLSVAGPVVLFLVDGAKATKVLDGWKTWMTANSTGVMAVLFLVFGVVLFSQGLSGLTA